MQSHQDTPMHFLPKVILTKIFLNLIDDDLLNLRLVCRFFREISNYVWLEKIKLDFKLSIDPDIRNNFIFYHDILNEERFYFTTLGVDTPY